MVSTGMVGNQNYSVMGWVWNSGAGNEEAFVSWGHRGGPTGSNSGFHQGVHPTFGAIGHWGGGALGNPNEPEFYDYIKSYSPYDNTVATAYPHLLITGGLNDPRVTYWEPTKWIAKLRAVRTNDRLLLMDMKMGAGHGGASGRFEHLRDTALEWAFALKALGKVGNDA